MKDAVKFYPKLNNEPLTLRDKNIPVNTTGVRRFIIVRTSRMISALKGIAQWLFNYHY